MVYYRALHITFHITASLPSIQDAVTGALGEEEVVAGTVGHLLASLQPLCLLLAPTHTRCEHILTWVDKLCREHAIGGRQHFTLGVRNNKNAFLNLAGLKI